jgi:hypothetical protein
VGWDSAVKSGVASWVDTLVASSVALSSLGLAAGKVAFLGDVGRVSDRRLQAHVEVLVDVWLLQDIGSGKLIPANRAGGPDRKGRPEDFRLPLRQAPGVTTRQSELGSFPMNGLEELPSPVPVALWAGSLPWEATRSAGAVS